MENRSILIYDIETDSKNPEEANLKWFFAYSTKTKEEYVFDYTQKEDITQLISEHEEFVGFNNNYFDNPITERFTGKKLKYNSLDLFEQLAPKGNSGFKNLNKNKLAQIGIKDLKNYKLKTIIEELGLDDEGSKKEIDYNIFKKDSWTPEEREEIIKYGLQDLKLTKKLFEWYCGIFNPIGELLREDFKKKLVHLKATIPSITYHVLCSQAGLIVEFSKEPPQNLKSYPGGHHIEAREKISTGNIVEIDFSSAYPHAMMMCNLYSPVNEGWDGNDYYKVSGKYNSTKQGKIEKVIHSILYERLRAKQTGDKSKNLSYKLIINSAYGLTGNWRFKSLYNPITASDCTSIVRTWMKKLAKHLECNGFICLYGFTDSIFVKIPDYANKDILMFLVNKVIEEFKSNVPFPLESFKMNVEEEIKMIWFVTKNCYLFLTKDNNIKYKSTLLNKNTPPAILILFEEYMKPKIIKETNISFTQKELEEEILKILEDRPELSGEEYTVNNLSEYKTKTSIHYLISDKYGEGRHILIPNKKGVGVGKTTTRCTHEEFKQNNLQVKDIDLKNLMKHIKPFTSFQNKIKTQEV